MQLLGHTVEEPIWIQSGIHSRRWPVSTSYLHTLDSSWKPHFVLSLGKRMECKKRRGSTLRKDRKNEDPGLRMWNICASVHDRPNITTTKAAWETHINIQWHLWRGKWKRQGWAVKQSRRKKAKKKEQNADRGRWGQASVARTKQGWRWTEPFKRHARRTTHIRTVRFAVRHSAHGVQSSSAAADTVRVRTDCAVWSGQRCPLDERDFMTRDLCHVVSWPGNRATWGLRGGLVEERVSDGGRGETKVRVWYMFSASMARCSELRIQTCPGRRSALCWRICQKVTPHHPTSSPLSRSLEESSIWWFLQRHKAHVDPLHSTGKRVNCRWKMRKTDSYPIWIAFLFVGKSCYKRRTRPVWWVPRGKKRKGILFY